VKKLLIKYWWNQLSVRFHQHFMCSFSEPRSQKRKKDCSYKWRWNRFQGLMKKDKIGKPLSNSDQFLSGRSGLISTLPLNKTRMYNPGLNFFNILRAAFAHADPKSAKIQWSRQYIFVLLGSASIKLPVKRWWNRLQVFISRWVF